MEQASSESSTKEADLSGLKIDAKTASTLSNTNDSSSSANMTDQHEEIVNLRDFHDKIRMGTSRSAYFSASSEDDDSSSDEDSAYRHQSNHASEDGSVMESVTGRKDTRIAAKLRLVVFVSFIAMGILFPIVIYNTTRSNEVEIFETTFDGLASKLVDSMEGQLSRTFGAVESLRVAITSHARSTNSTWPFVTLPDYDLRAESVGDLGDVISVTLHPLVTLVDRLQWEKYVVENIDWLNKSLERQGLELAIPGSAEESDDGEGENGGRRLSVPDVSRGFSKDIFVLDESSPYGVKVDASLGPYFPTWQSYPAVPSIVNMNAFSLDILHDATVALMDSGKPVLSRVAFLNNSDTLSGSMADYVNSLLEEFAGTDASTTGAVATLSYPVFQDFLPEADKTVAMFTSLLFFEEFFTGILPPNPGLPESVVCVVKNGCGDVFSYKITGEKAEYLGPNDHHDDTFDDLAQQYIIRLNADYCPYQMRLYPHQDMQEQYITNQPVVYSVSFALVIVVVVVASLAYDFYVQRQMRRAVKSARDNQAIVSSLFPANVRARLIQEEDDRKRADERDPRRRDSGDGSSRRGSNENRNRRLSNDKEKRRASAELGITDYIPFGNAVVGLTNMALAPAKQRLKFFLNNEDKSPAAVEQHQYDPEMQNSSTFDTESKPIADLFPHCTVLFSDIAGFTAWSSEREPEQVFMLLQTIFQKFDSLAKKRQIFKVETIGDCYVAVTGLPDPQPDHAIRMTKFARACMHKVAQLTQKLEVALGPGTGDLRMRFGLHSGPVTAGVLRGEKSRFQLFGDTVNTASRMESTGQRNRIQISHSTAQLLIEGGKENWIQPREDVVIAKGKGPIQTYWVLTRRQSPSINTLVEDRPKFIQSKLHDSNSDLESIGSGILSLWGEEEYKDDEAGAYEVPSVMLGGNSERLIDWQVDLLLRLIKQILAGRDANVAPLESPADVIKSNSAVFEEVSESIELPKFDAEAARARAEPTIVQVPDVIIDELREYVSMIACRYRDNPFHNFAHANHVSMSANKLLSRIVLPEDVNYHRKSVKAIASDLHQYTYGITSDPLTQFAIMVSTLVHDVDHTGVSNPQRGKEDPKLAEKYHHKSVAEQNSIDLAWNLFMDPKFKNLQQAIFSTETEVRRFRQLLVNLVMATDIFDPTQKSTRNLRWEKVFHSDLRDRVDDDEFRNLKATIVIEHIIQAADVSHTMQHWQVYTKWNERLFNEMYRAFAEGRSENDPSTGWYKGELWFFDSYVIPLAKKLEECGVFGVTSDECLNYALENRKEWEIKGEQIVREMVEKIKAKKNQPADSSIKSADKPDRRTSFGYYARRSATFMIALPKNQGRNDSGNGVSVDSESWDCDDESIELQLHGTDKTEDYEQDDRKHSEKENKKIETIYAQYSDSDRAQPTSPSLRRVKAPSTTGIYGNVATREDRGYDSEDDDSIVVDA